MLFCAFAVLLENTIGQYKTVRAYDTFQTCRVSRVNIGISNRPSTSSKRTPLLL